MPDQMQKLRLSRVSQMLGRRRDNRRSVESPLAKTKPVDKRASGEEDVSSARGSQRPVRQPAPKWWEPEWWEVASLGTEGWLGVMAFFGVLLGLLAAGVL